jgi:hypothetical protein
MPAITATEDRCGRLRASDADREQAVEALKAAFVFGCVVVIAGIKSMTRCLS